MDFFILLINKTAARLASYTYKQVFVFYLVNTLCSVESDELEHNVIDELIIAYYFVLYIKIT